MIRLFNHWFTWRSIAGVLFDFSFLIVSLIITLMWINSGLPVNLQQIVVYAILFGLVMLAINGLLGLYQRVSIRPITETRARAVLSIYLSIPIAYALYALLPIAAVNRDLIHLSAMSAVFGMLVTRVGAAHAPAAKMLRRRILVFGTGQQALAVKRALDRSDPSAEIIGFFPGSNEDQALVSPNLILSRDRSLTDTARNLNADEIVVALSERRGGSMPMRELLDCKLQGIKVMDLSSHFEQTLGQIRLDSLYAGWLIFGDGFSQGAFRTFVKRLFDIVCASILIILATPVMMLAALLIVLEDGFPLLYRQERVGVNGRLFNVIKFRSMRRDAEKDGKPIWAQAKDNRVTRVGQIIRKLRIDELPQLFSVLNGDMSLVGPRPERPFFVDQLTKEIPFYAVRHSVKPGVTGWAQVRYHYGATVEDSAEKLQYDLYYVKNHSLFLDMVVLFETVGVVLTGKGAH
ncbi:MAG: TIGR03013 family PEP-CTERM/XrtA system glycosyltransferase [Betaproteobacteria bacterium]|jgi:sugar transferase (PEP-CTERM system associated)|nr:TIGR03013 family PEP-CTERM/XrtA system glycosyltransferase [Betaproteobacteria bacterium]